MVWQAALILAAAVAPASDSDKAAATQAYKNCLAKKAVDLDDGTSDPLSVGKVMVSFCDTELVQVADTFTRGEKRQERVRRYMIDDLRSDYTTPASIVLEWRKSRRAQ